MGDLDVHAKATHPIFYTSQAAQTDHHQDEPEQPKILSILRRPTHESNPNQATTACETNMVTKQSTFIPSPSNTSPTTAGGSNRSLRTLSIAESVENSQTSWPQEWDTERDAQERKERQEKERILYPGAKLKEIEITLGDTQIITPINLLVQHTIISHSTWHKYIDYLKRKGLRNAPYDAYKKTSIDGRKQYLTHVEAYGKLYEVAGPFPAHIKIKDQEVKTLCFITNDQTLGIKIAIGREMWLPKTLKTNTKQRIKVISTATKEDQIGTNAKDDSQM